MSIVYYEAPTPSATAIGWALAELNVPHQRIRLDARDEPRGPDRETLRSTSGVPTLVVDGNPMFETLSILTWLGERYGVAQGLWPPADAPTRLEALSWSTWAFLMYGSALHRLAACTLTEASRLDLRRIAQAEQVRGELRRLLGVLDSRLAAGPYLLGETFSLADLVVSSVVGYGIRVGASVDRHPHVKAWLERCRSRPKLEPVLAA